MSVVVQGLWIGPRLSVMERLSISSFLANGQEYHLYVYDAVEDIPEGTIVRDGNEILPSSMIFQYKDQKSYSGFSNFFRYKLLLERGGWWADTDIVCLRPFVFSDDYVFASEQASDLQIANCGVMKAPIASEVMSYAWQVCRSKDPKQIRWGETGPRLLEEAVKRFSLEKYLKPFNVFCPLGYLEWSKVLDPNADLMLDETTHAVHLWHEMWRRAEKDKDGDYEPDCLYEQLKRKYLR